MNTSKKIVRFFCEVRTVSCVSVTGSSSSTSASGCLDCESDYKRTKGSRSSSSSAFQHHRAERRFFRPSNNRGYVVSYCPEIFYGKFDIETNAKNWLPA